VYATKALSSFQKHDATFQSDLEKPISCFQNFKKRAWRQLPAGAIRNLTCKPILREWAAYQRKATCGCSALNTPEVSRCAGSWALPLTAENRFRKAGQYRAAAGKCLTMKKTILSVYRTDLNAITKPRFRAGNSNHRGKRVLCWERIQTGKLSDLQTGFFPLSARLTGLRARLAATSPAMRRHRCLALRKYARFWCGTLKWFLADVAYLERVCGLAEEKNNTGLTEPETIIHRRGRHFGSGKTALAETFPQPRGQQSCLYGL